MTSEAFAQAVADFFRAKDYPFLGIEVKLDGTFPMVMMWDNDVLMSRMIACTCDENDVLNALTYANNFAKQDEAAGNQPCGVIVSAAWPDGWTDIPLDNAITFVEGS